MRENLVDVIRGESEIAGYRDVLNTIHRYDSEIIAFVVKII